MWAGASWEEFIKLSCESRRGTAQVSLLSGGGQLAFFLLWHLKDCCSVCVSCALIQATFRGWLLFLKDLPSLVSSLALKYVAKPKTLLCLHVLPSVAVQCKVKCKWAASCTQLCFQWELYLSVFVRGAVARYLPSSQLVPGLRSAGCACRLLGNIAAWA